MNGLRAILALYVLVWFNVVVPAHTRGMITLQPGTGETIASSSCCSSEAASSDPADPSQPAKPKSRGPCAVCYVAATYTTIAPFVFDFTPGARVDQSIPLAERDLRARGVELAIYPTGPPRA
jgi:hypothetical protein